tara:strand:- start:7763 stop:8047 length:285 start_codon:yes stop_codon:yes gene_type:complete
LNAPFLETQCTPLTAVACKPPESDCNATAPSDLLDGIVAIPEFLLVISVIPDFLGSQLLSAQGKWHWSRPGQSQSLVRMNSYQLRLFLHRSAST